MDPAKLSKTLRSLRRRLNLSLNALAQATGISRRTLARIESGQWGPIHPEPVPSKAEGRTRRASRTAFRLAKALLSPKQIEQVLDDYTPLSRSLGNDPLLKFLDSLYHYPAFLFHDSPGHAALREQFGSDYRHSLDLLIRSSFGTRNLGRRLRAFRLTHDLTLKETASLLDLSTSHLHSLERGLRSASPRTRFRILRLLTLPIGDASRSEALAERRSRAQPRDTRRQWLESLRLLLSLPAPSPPNSEVEPLEQLRYAWLTSNRKTKDLAAALSISQPHLIRLLRGDRRPSRALKDRIEQLAP